MARPMPIERQLQLATSGLSPDAIRRELAAFAKREVAALIQKGEVPPRYTRFVNGREGAPEESVTLPGPIVYDFDRLSEVIAFALREAEQRSPKKSGRYRESWFVMVGGALWTGGEIPSGAEVLVTNDQPYHRKIEVGAMRMSVPPGIVEAVYQAVRRRFGNRVRADVRFVTLAGGYRLKRNGARRGRRAGDPMTYPALLLQDRFA